MLNETFSVIFKQRELRVILLCILNVYSGGFNFFVHSLKFSSRVTKCFVSPAELMCSSTDPHPPTLKFRNKNGSNKTRLFLVYLSLKSRKFNDALWIWDFGAHWSKIQIFLVCYDFFLDFSWDNINFFFYKISRFGSVCNHTIRKVNYLSKNSILTKPQHFHEFFTQNFFDNFSREIKVVNS